VTRFVYFQTKSVYLGSRLGPYCHWDNIIALCRTTTTRRSMRRWTICSSKKKTTRVCGHQLTHLTTLTTLRWLSALRSTS